MRLGDIVPSGDGNRPSGRSATDEDRSEPSYRQALEALALEDDPEQATHGAAFLWGEFGPEPTEFFGMVQANAWDAIRAIEAGDPLPDDDAWLEIVVVTRVWGNRRERLMKNCGEAFKYAAGGAVGVVLIWPALSTGNLGDIRPGGYSVGLLVAEFVVAGFALLGGVGAYVHERWALRAVNRAWKRLGDVDRLQRSAP